jgi:hypothetical protein
MTLRVTVTVRDRDRDIVRVKLKGRVRDTSIVSSAAVCITLFLI